MKKLLSLLLIICLSLSLLSGCKKDNNSSDSDTSDGNNSETKKPVETTEADRKVGFGACEYVKTRNTEGHNLRYVKMVVKGHGSIVLMLDATTAPITVENFMTLVNSGFYDGLTFHRVLSGFMIQGGDPKGTGSGGNTDKDGNKITIKGEFSANNVPNDISHLRGVISMAREGNQVSPSAAYNTASSQFFICNADATGLDGDYASFGYVMAGLDVVDRITAEGMEHTSEYYNGMIYADKYQPVIASISEISEAEALANVSIPESEIDYCYYYKTRNTDTHNVKYVKMTVKNHGDIILMLDATTAPITVENFMMLVNKGFYDGLTFHRIIENFMIQGGDPDANGTGGHKDDDGNQLTIKGEFSANDVPNDISHLRGVISMARGAYSYDSASSQFFICNANSPHLDGNYAAFGYVISGLDVVDSITEEGVKHTSDGVISDKSKQPVISSVIEITKDEALAYINNGANGSGDPIEGPIVDVTPD